MAFNENQGQTNMIEGEGMLVFNYNHSILHSSLISVIFEQALVSNICNRPCEYCAFPFFLFVHL